MAVFDGWIRQFVDKILNVDVEEWDIYDRWQITNAVIAGQLLTLSAQDDGSAILAPKRVTEPVAEEKSSVCTAAEVPFAVVAAAQNSAGGQYAS